MKRARNMKRWGGARAGAGRPPAGTIASERHKTRPAIASAHAVHVTARIVDRVGVDRAIEPAIDRAIELSRARADFRIVHLGIRVRGRDAQLELIVEARDKLALARGMQGFQVSAARSLNRAARRTGCVFPDRYRARLLISRPAVLRAIASLPARAQRIGMAESPLLDGM